MRIQETLEGAGDSFYFDTAHSGELVVRSDVLPDGPVPEAIRINGRSIIGHYVSPQGGEAGSRAYDLSWSPGLFRAGELLVAVESGSGDAVLGKVGSDGYYNYLHGGEITGRYHFAPGDTLVTRCESWNPRHTADAVLLPAMQPFPREKGETFHPMGVITGLGKLVAWGSQAPMFVEWAVANRLARSREDLHQLDIERQGMSLVNAVRANRLANAYLEQFRERFGEDYFPQVEVWSRLAELPISGE